MLSDSAQVEQAQLTWFRDSGREFELTLSSRATLRFVVLSKEFGKLRKPYDIHKANLIGKGGPFIDQMFNSVLPRLPAPLNYWQVIPWYFKEEVKELDERVIKDFRQKVYLAVEENSVVACLQEASGPRLQKYKEYFQPEALQSRVCQELGIT